ncbi:phospholipid scramblase 1-like [Homarus americanus]|uniref:Phospholipid scramblase n=1 Tax=Homarus americanus TaxID=6706 RepID=A0A8J5JTA2_HOMAM|nr:phospholipid scramblase 1-like [Homarus americanus]XP_042231146.1 phospholipid scramblase 1-like [Homarus americanus]KAG7163846.1 Phospholipid scramblase 2-like 3 [Homarus americanus]
MAYTVPPGLDYLTQLDQVLVKQKHEIFEILSGCEMNNKYELKNSLGQQFLLAKEDTDCCTRQCCGPMRPYEMALLDNQEQEIIHLSRPLACINCCCSCCLQSLEVSSPPGSAIGTIHQEWSICTPMAGKFTIRNVSGDVVLRIEGPVCAFSCGGDVVFKIFNEDNSAQIGHITKQWRGFCAEAFTDADNFGLTFPMDLEVRFKALIIGAAFLIDFMYFEKAKN